MDWQRSSIEAAAAYLHELIEAGTTDCRTKSVYEGLLEVLEPSRYATRRKGAAAADAAAAIMYGARERRTRLERRGHTDRRLVNFGPFADGERRSGQARRCGIDRRSR